MEPALEEPTAVLPVRESRAGSVCSVPGRFIWKKPFPAPQDAITAVPNSRTCGDEFTSPRSDNLLLIKFRSFPGGFSIFLNLGLYPVLNWGLYPVMKRGFCQVLNWGLQTVMNWGVY
jgi:hypothetical protein